MRVLSFADSSDRGAVICLGRFDGLHIGHKKLIEMAERVSAGALEVDLFTLRFPEPKGDIFSFDELLAACEKAGVDTVVYADVDNSFFSLTPSAFTDALKERFNARRFVCGEDFSYGKNRSGNVATLKDYCDSNGLYLTVAETVTADGEKVSSTLIRSLLSEGKVRRANELLGYVYSVKGIVISGRKDGRKLGVSTANVAFPKEKAKILSGVYATETTVDGKTYKSVSNYGGAPTFGIENSVVETHILDYDGDLYGKEIKIGFVDFIRKNIKFDTKEQLEERLKKDIGFYD